MHRLVLVEAEQLQCEQRYLPLFIPSLFIFILPWENVCSMTLLVEGPNVVTNVV